MVSSIDRQESFSSLPPLDEDIDSTAKETIVSFNEVVIVLSTLSRDDYSDEEVERCWLAQYEMEDTLDRIAKIAQRMASGKKPKRGSSYRGLENATVEGETEYYFSIQDVVESVLAEQERQYREGFCDEYMIAEASEMYTETSLATAMKRGKSDAREARKAYRKIEDMYDPCNEGSCSSFSHFEEDPVPVVPVRGGSDSISACSLEDDDIVCKMHEPTQAIC